MYLTLYREITPAVNTIKTITFNFENQLNGDQDGGTISSTSFTYNGYSCSLVDNGAGVLQIQRVQSGSIITENADAGSVNYTTGLVTLSDFTVSAYAGTTLRIYAVPAKRDVVSTKNIILNIGADETTVTVAGIVQ